MQPRQDRIREREYMVDWDIYWPFFTAYLLMEDWKHWIFGMRAFRCRLSFKCESWVPWWEE